MKMRFVEDDWLIQVAEERKKKRKEYLKKWYLKNKNKIKMERENGF